MVFKDVVLDLKTEKMGNQWSIIISDIGYTPSEIARKYNINQGTVSTKLSRKSSEEFRFWLQNRIEIESLGLPPNSVLFKRDGAVCWSGCVMEATGCGSSHANNILHAWQNGYIDCDELFNPKRKKKYTPRKTNGVGTANWRGLSNKSRGFRLAKMKKVGTWEQGLPEPDGFFNGSPNHVVGHAGVTTFLKGD